MEIKNVIKRELSLTIIETIIVLIIIIFIALELGKYFLRNNLTKTVKVDNLIVELNPIIDTKLSSLTDYEGLNLKGNNITITNNNDTTKYQLLICGNKDNNNTIRVGLNNYLIRSLNNFPYDNNCYTLDTSKIKDHSTTIYQIKLWLNKSSNTTKKVKYTFQVKKLD